MDELAQLTASVLRLKSTMEQANYKGYDPYDGLLSPLFRLPILRSNHELRFLAQQGIKRSLVNIRPVLCVPKGENPVTLGLVVLAHYHLKNAGLINHEKSTQSLVKRLTELRSPGRPFSCWGYDFPWAARHAEIPGHGPTVVATGIITDALFKHWSQTGCEQSADLVSDACEFVINDLNRTEVETGGFIFSYSPFDHETVLNASMKAIRLLTQGHVIHPSRGYDQTARIALSAVLGAQRQDGSWPYSLRSNGDWVDNYHTGYVLDGLDEYIKNTGDLSPQVNLDKGLNLYCSRFVGDDGRPFLYSNRQGPADCTAAGQTMLTLTRFGEQSRAAKVAMWMIRNMQSGDGQFYYRKYKFYINTTRFMRWSNAWMFAGLSAVLCSERRKGGKP